MARPRRSLRERDYQNPRDPVRALAEAAQAALRRDVKAAMLDLRKRVPVAAIARHIRAGRLAQARDAVPLDHFREVLKEPFQRLGEIWNDAADVGAGRINRDFKRAGQRVRYRPVAKGFDPDEPRDERGRWTGGGGLGVSSSGKEATIEVGGRMVTAELSTVSRGTGDRMVMIDAKAFDRAFARDRGFYVPPGGRGAGAIEGRYDRFREFLGEHDQFQVSEVGVQADGTVGFTNGRHRYAVLRDLGASQIPVAMDRTSRRNARRHGYLAGVAKLALVKAAKATHAEANYRPGRAPHVCGMCWMFQAPASCVSVDDPIEVLGVCDYFEALVSVIRLHSSKRQKGVRKAVGDGFDFDLLDDETQEALREIQDELIAELDQGARDTIESVITRGVNAGDSADDIAANLRDTITLTERQAQAVANYRNLLEDLNQGALDRELRNKDFDDLVQDAIDSGEFLSDSDIEAMVEDYASNYLDYRADTIAKTESLRAANAGLRDSYRQAAARGVFPEEAVTRQWQIATDERVCPICQSIADNNPDGVGLNADFESDDGPVDDPPVHPSCRCTVDYITNLDMLPEDEGDDESEANT